MKKMKKSFLLPLIGIIAVITIVGVGFAAWAIISPININDASGNITAEQLTDRTFTITATQNDSTKKIHFGKGTDTVTETWFRDDHSEAQNLTTTLTITLTPTTAPTQLTDIDTYLEGRSIDVMLKTSKYTQFKNAIDNNYIAMPKLTVGSTNSELANAESDWSDENPIKLNLKGSDFKQSEDFKTYTATITLTFAWGSVTEGKDAYTYFNAQENDDANITLAKAVCNAVYALNDATYTISFAKVDAPKQ